MLRQYVVVLPKEGTQLYPELLATVARAAF